MTTNTAAPPPLLAAPEPPHAQPRIGFGQILLTVPHLVVLGLLGTAAFTALAALIGVGLGLAFVFGIGLAILVGVVYLLFALGWFELERVRGLYGFEVAPLRLRASESPGFGGWLRAIGRQSIDRRMWLSLLNFAIGSCFGLIVVSLVTMAAWNVTIMFGGERLGALLGPWRFFGPGTWGFDSLGMQEVFASPLWSLLVVVLTLATIIGLAALHAVISRAMLGTSSRGALMAEVRSKSVQREGAVRAADVERTRIERDLHDGVQPRLVSIGMTLGRAGQKIDEDPAAAKALIAEAHTSTKAAITELRQLARGIHASVLDDRGLDAALSALAARSHIPVLLDVRMEGAADLRQRQGIFRDAEAAVYFSIAEALTNAAKHSRAAECRVTVRLRDAGTPQAVLWARVEDNGIGGATVQPGGGLDGISNRVLAAGGRLHLDSPQGGPTALEVSVPCAS